MKDNHQSTESNKGNLLDRYSNQPQQDGEKSPFYKSSAPSVSLPKGGGALKGIDEKFSVNAVNGTAGMEIPLPLSPGRGGFTPALGLGYSSGGGNSEFGLGWNLSLPSIQRRTDKKLPRYNDAEESDVFILAGAEDMIPVTDDKPNPATITETKNGTTVTYTIKRYRPRIEGLFARIEYITQSGQGGGWWRVTSRDNITTYYGLTPAGRISDPEDARRIFKWLPELSVDHKGNVQYYSYVAEDTRGLAAEVFEKNRLNGGPARIANTYLKQVQYNNLEPYFIEDTETQSVYAPALPVSLTYLMACVLDYDDQGDIYKPNATPEVWPGRSDAFSDFHAGFEIRTYRRCRRVLMYHYFNEMQDKNLVRSLELGYRRDGADAGTLSEADYIVKAWQVSYQYKSNAWRSKALPAIKIGYQELEWDTRIQQVSREDFQGAPQGLTGPYQWLDFEGEGISGIMTEQGGGWFYKNNLGDGHFAPPHTIAEKPSFTGLGQGSLQWQDLDADGRRQIVSQSPLKGYWELDDAPTGTDQAPHWQPFKAFRQNINIDWNSPFTRVLDLDGDGRADVLITEDRAWIWYENQGKDGYGKGGNSPLFSDEEKGPTLLLRDEVQSIFLADMNGDGMTDLVRIRNGEVCYWPNMGYGRFGAKVSMSHAPRFARSEQYDPRYLTLADISGTGAADLIYLGNDLCEAWINLSGNGFSEKQVIGTLPATDSYSKIAVLDFLGNGTGCIVWSSPLPQHAHAPLCYIDLMGGRKPYLMQSYSNGMGKTVKVTYKSSAQFYIADKLASKPWATRLPFPVHCISNVTTEDAVSQTRYTQTYRYRHGYYDHEEREFRGFGYVETLDIDKADLAGGDSLDQAPVLTKTWYHTGAWMRERSLLDRYEQEYFVFEGFGDLPRQAVAVENGLDAATLREAYRALKGSPLRQEVYALDGGEYEGVPYTATASTYRVKMIQAHGTNRYASFLNLQEQKITVSCERHAADPRIQQELTLETDRYGNVLQSASIAYPRKQQDATLPQRIQDEQALMHIVYTRSSLTNDVVEAAAYRLRLPAEMRSYEALGLTAPATGLFTVAGLNEQINGKLPGIAPAAEIDFAAVPTGAREIRLLSHTRILYKDDQANDEPLPAGQLRSLALPHEQYQLAYTDDVLEHCFKKDNDILVNNDMLLKAGYVQLDNGTPYWLPSGRAHYSNPRDKFYTPERYSDPWGKSTEISFGAAANAYNYWMLPQSTTDALGNTQSVLSYDWRLLQPLAFRDANNNVSHVLYDTLGFAAAMAQRGKEDANGNSPDGDQLDGLDPDSSADLALQQAFWLDPESKAADLLEGATWRCVYDLQQSPAAVAMIAREYHFKGPYPEVTPANDIQMRFSYSDGFGRLLMHKVPCEPEAATPLISRWIGSGRTIYNNKGKAVMQYEPYFSPTFHCDLVVQAAQQGISPKLYYDPLGRLRLTMLPDGSYSKTEWTAWQQTVYDNNDTVGLGVLNNGEWSIQSPWYVARKDNQLGAEALDAAHKARAHANTPSIVHTDNLSRPVYTIQVLEVDATGKPVELINSYVKLDISGNRLSVTDGRGLEPLSYRYNMLQQPCYQLSIDSGEAYTLTDVAGQPLVNWDADLRCFTTGYDDLRRPLTQTVAEAGTVKLLEYTEYGESQPGNPAVLNLRGQVYARYDGSSKRWMPDGYDFKGNPVKASLSLLKERTITDVNWNTHPDLEDKVYSNAAQLDALNRPMKTLDPGENVSIYAYDKGGALNKVTLNGKDYVGDIRYNARGQREAIWYGNKTKTRYHYEPLTYRLSRLCTVTLDPSNSYYGEKLQDLNYTYDPVGNITLIRDLSQKAFFYDNSIIEPEQDFTYDALYRLVQASGREQDTDNDPPFGGGDRWLDTPAANNPGSNTSRSYTQYYTYDEAGNIRKLRHRAGSGSYTRIYDIDDASNRMSGTQIDTAAYAYHYDTRGNMNDMPHLDELQWNSRNQLYFLKQSTTQAWYQYGGGQRIRKYVDKVSLKEERIYLGNFEIYRKFDSSSLTDPIVERTTVHVSDDTGRIAMLEVRTIGTEANDNGTLRELTRYIYSNHLQSASLELDEAGEIISYEEYHPYGTSAYQAKSSAIKATAKRYRYTGKERDEESGLYYHGARYYIPWLCRWSMVDPLESMYAGMSPYNYSFNNPVIWTDRTGMAPEDSAGEPVRAKNPAAINAPLKTEPAKPKEPPKSNSPVKKVSPADVTSNTASFTGKEAGGMGAASAALISTIAEMVTAEAIAAIAAILIEVIAVAVVAFVIAYLVYKLLEPLLPPAPAKEQEQQEEGIARNYPDDYVDTWTKDGRADPNVDDEPGPEPSPAPKPKPEPVPPPIIVPDDPRKHVQKAIVRQYDNGGGDVGHFTIEVIDDEKSLTTHQWSQDGMTWITNNLGKYAGQDPVHQAVVELTDAEAAMRFQQNVMELGELGPYDELKNSCLSHVADVISQGGGEQINRTRPGYARFLTKYGFKPLKRK